EIQDAGAFDVEADVEVVGLLVEEVAGVGALVAAGAVVSAAQVGAGADPLVGPALPLAGGVPADPGLGRLLRRGAGGPEPDDSPGDQCDAGRVRHGRPLWLFPAGTGRDGTGPILSRLSPAARSFPGSSPRWRRQRARKRNGAAQGLSPPGVGND